MIRSIPDLVTDAVELLNFVVNVCIKLGRNHSDLAFVGLGYKLIGFCHNSVHFKGLTYRTNDLTLDTFLPTER